MSQYRRGADFERAVRLALQTDGYTVVRSAGSKSKIDLLAIKPGQCLFIQCKTNGLCPPAERIELRRLAGLIHALPIVAYKDGSRLAYRELTGDGPKDWVAWVSDEVAA